MSDLLPVFIVAFFLLFFSKFLAPVTCLIFQMKLGIIYSPPKHPRRHFYWKLH